MIRSMTGFGRSEMETKGHKFTVEMRSLNHRYLELGIKLPRQLLSLESEVRNLTRQYLERGKVDIFIFFEDLSSKPMGVRYNGGIAQAYYGYFKKISSEFGLENDIKVSSLSSLPEVFQTEETKLDLSTIWHELDPPVTKALEDMVKARETEGEALKKDLLKKLKVMESQVSEIEEHAPRAVFAYRENLLKKMNELLEESLVDPGRIAMEAAIFADRMSVDEEMVRLKSHIKAMEDILEGDSLGAVGRKLDFIAQEMNREANTTLSKAGDLATCDASIELKTLIEKIREQVQNIE